MTLKRISVLFLSLFFAQSNSYKIHEATLATTTPNYPATVQDEQAERTDGLLGENLNTSLELTNDPFLAEIIEEERRLNATKNKQHDIITEDDLLSNYEIEIGPPNRVSKSQETIDTKEVSNQDMESEISESLIKEDTILGLQQNKPIVNPAQRSEEMSTSAPEEVNEEIIVPRISHQRSLSLSGLTGSLSSVGHGLTNTFGGLGRQRPKQQQQPSPPTPTASEILKSRSDNMPEQLDPKNETSSPKCNEDSTNYGGSCHKVLQQGPCSNGTWLIEDEVSKTGVCEANKCLDDDKDAHKTPFGDLCVPPGSKQYCHPGMRVYIFKNGKSECDCEEGYLFNEKDGNCYAALRKGPCKQHEIFTLNKAKHQTMCAPNPCLTDGYACNAPRCPRQRNCVELNKQTCPQGGVYLVNPKKYTIECSKPTQPDPVVGNVPTLVCAPGSRRDILGSCRKPTDITFS